MITADTKRVCIVFNVYDVWNFAGIGVISCNVVAKRELDRLKRLFKLSVYFLKYKSRLTAIAHEKILM